MEWEDAGLDRLHGAPAALAYLRGWALAPGRPSTPRSRRTERRGAHTRPGSCRPASRDQVLDRSPRVRPPCSLGRRDVHPAVRGADVDKGLVLRVEGQWPGPFGDVAEVEDPAILEGMQLGIARRVAAEVEHLHLD